MRALRLAAFALAAVLLVGSKARAELHFDLEHPNPEPLPIAIPEFAGGQVAHDMTQVVSADLERSGLFRPLDPRSFTDKEGATRTPPNYADWRVIGAQALVTGTVEGQSDGRLQVEFRLWSVLDEQQMTGVRYTTTPQNWRRIAHIMADAIYKRITGEDGYFDTRVV
jgi:TolB protein